MMTVNDALVRMWKEAVVAWKKQMKSQDRTRARNLPDKKQEAALGPHSPLTPP